MGNLSENKIYKILDIARFAPSSHNTQPWKLSICKNCVKVFPDFEKALDIADPDNRELFISLGCLIANIGVVANKYGLGVKIIYSKQKNNPIKVYFKKSKKESFNISEIKQRRTNRNKYSQKSLPDDLLDSLRKLCEKDVNLDFLTGENKESVSKMVYKGDIQQFSNPKYRKELSHWIKKGVMGGGKIYNAISAFFVSNFNLGKSIGKKDSLLIKSSPVYAVLGTKKDRVRDWIDIGISYEKIALYLTSKGISNHPMNQGLLELKNNRKKISKMCNKMDYAQFGFRIGYSEKKDKKSSTRLKLDELFTSSNKP
ncbi:MAG TPA: hypothetical protein VJ912_04360 [Candidatus Nanoarchaeia archaeon]|nr:hypothetical protein [Candidatus Nanoarchaeia archaeon]